MVAFGHTSVGVIVGASAFHYLGQGNLITGLFLTGAAGVVSHYLMDFVPHGHFFRGKKNFRKFIPLVIIFDLILPVLLFIGAARALDKSQIEILYILFGIGGAQLPDIVDSLMELKFLPRKGVLKLENKFHQSTHWHGSGDSGLLWSIFDIWQITMLLIAFYILYRGL